MWEAFLDESFPAWLLPASAVRSLSIDAAKRFLSVISGGAASLDRLRAASTLAMHASSIATFARSLPGWAESLSGQCLPIRTEGSGILRGRLDVTGTLRRRLQGDRATLVVTTRERRFDRPEDVLVAAVARILREQLRRVSLDERSDQADRWTRDLRGSRMLLERILRDTRASEIPVVPIERDHIEASRGAHARVYREAAALFSALREGLDDDRPDVIARVIAAGALTPLSADRRFELAVALRLVRVLHDRLDDPEWSFERPIVIAGREEIARFSHRSGARIDVYFDTARLDAGMRFHLGKHYLRSNPMRPDVTVSATNAKASTKSIVVECKRSDDPSYLAQGFSEAVLYRHEYGEQLFASPGAVLVAPDRAFGTIRRGDAVIACSFADWPSPEVIETLVGYAAAGCSE
jgi:hypothetical protein